MNSKIGLSTAVSRYTLEEAPSRALTFLRALSTLPVIRSAMEGAGYTEADHEEGWKLFFAMTGYGPEDRTPVVANKAAAVIAELQAWQSPWFQRARAALRRKHPEQEALVFQDLAAARGAEAIPAMALFLDRLDALEDGLERKATRKSDHAALATLVTRGITKAMRKDLRKSLEFVRTHKVPDAPVRNVDTSKREEGLIALHAWLQDWSDTARVVVARRDLQIRLGLARRRPRAGKTTPPPQETAPVQTRVTHRAASVAEEESGPSSRAA